MDASLKQVALEGLYTVVIGLRTIVYSAPLHVLSYPIEHVPIGFKCQETKARRRLHRWMLR